MKKEFADYNTHEIDRFIYKKDKELERLYNERNKDKEGGEEGERWRPSREEINQGHREKIYSEYIDTVKADALSKGKLRKYNQVERDFLQKYKKEVLDKNLHNREGEAFKPSKKSEDYVSKLKEQRDFIRMKMQQVRLREKEHEEFLKEKKRESLIDQSTEGHVIRSNYKQREDIEKYYRMNKSKMRLENEDYLYRSEFAKRNPKAKAALEAEDTINMRFFKNNYTDEIELEEIIKNNIDTWDYSDRVLKKDFSKKLSRGDVVKGLLQRKKQLKEDSYEKELSEIAHGDNPAYENLYRKYMAYKESEKPTERKENISGGEKFLDAVEENFKQTSAKENRSFQEYEDYKRNLQVTEDPYDYVDNSVIPNEEQSTRDWYAKVWSGKITNEEFGDYMFEKKQSKNNLGQNQTSFKQKSNPGYGNKDFLTTEDKKRITEEFLETKRREAIMSGLTTEEESHKYVQTIMKKLSKSVEFLNRPSTQAIKDKLIESFKAITQGEQVREYYFDEEQGVTLEEHIKAAQKLNPNARFETYVDNDGFTVVKKRVEKQYKYKLDDLLNYAPSEVESKYFRGIKSLIDKNNINIRNEEDLVRFLENPQYKQSDIYKELMKIQEKYGGIVEDIETFKDDIREQIEIKKLRYKYFNKLSQDDFVKAQVPEKVVMEKLKQSYTNTVLNHEASIDRSNYNADYLANLKRKDKKLYEDIKHNPDMQVMSKEDYSRLREQIKEKKEAKARLLKQGFPSLKNYVYL